MGTCLPKMLQWDPMTYILLLLNAHHPLRRCDQAASSPLWAPVFNSVK